LRPPPPTAPVMPAPPAWSASDRQRGRLQALEHLRQIKAALR
jgi:hypothetical protein